MNSYGEQFDPADERLGGRVPYCSLPMLRFLSPHRYHLTGQEKTPDEKGAKNLSLIISGSLWVWYGFFWEFFGK
jgi:hypothetical protein